MYIGRTRDDVIHAGKGRVVHLPGLPNVKVDGYSPKTREVLSICVVKAWLSMYAQSANLIGNTEETLMCRHEETTARIQKNKNAGYEVVLIWGASLENCCAKIQD